MEISRHNYEAFLLDHLEGKLSEDDQQRLYAFLLLNPDCAPGEMEGDLWMLEPEAVQFQAKSFLKKEFPGESSLLTDHNFDLFSIARMEGDLSGEQEVAHQLMIEKDAQKSAQWMEWQKVKLHPGTISFADKDRLYHRKGIGRKTLWISVVSAAAAIALVFVLFRMGPMPTEQELTQELSPETEISPNSEILNPEIPGQAEPRVNQEIEVESRDVQAKPAVMFSVKKEHERPAEKRAKERILPGDDLKPRPVRFAANNPRTSLPVGEAVPDRIEALDIQPVPIHLSSLSIAQLSELDLREMVDEYAAEKDLSIWTVANAGIKGINKIAGSDISLLAARDEDGEVSGFRLKSRRFSMTRPLGREE